MSLGRAPEEQAHNQKGYDIRSTADDGSTVWLEVKSRIEWGATFSISRNQVLKALNTREQFRLALVKVSQTGPGADELRYVGDPFSGVEPGLLSDFNVEALTLNFDEWWARGVPPF